VGTEAPVVWYLDAADEVLACFEQLYKRYTSGIVNMEPWHTPNFISNQIGSHKLKLVCDNVIKKHFTCEGEACYEIAIFFFLVFSSIQMCFNSL
jgi:hypothetical protein